MAAKEQGSFSACFLYWSYRHMPNEKGETMKEELKLILNNMNPRRNLKWFWIEYIRWVNPNKEIGYGYFNRMINDFCTIKPEIEATVKTFIEKNNNKRMETWIYLKRINSENTERS